MNLPFSSSKDEHGINNTTTQCNNPENLNYPIKEACLFTPQTCLKYDSGFLD
jgi:hypothetical protein